MRTCPRCQQQMRRAAVASVEVDECPHCKGLWFENHELRLAKDRTDPEVAWMDFEIWKHPDRFRVTTRPLTCPGCASGMVGIEYGTTHVTLDYCPACRGVWLDGGEFQNIIKALTHEVSSKSAREYVQASLREAGELLTGSESLPSEWRDLRSVLKLLQQRLFIERPELLGIVLGLPRF